MSGRRTFSKGSAASKKNAWSMTLTEAAKYNAEYRDTVAILNDRINGETRVTGQYLSIIGTPDEGTHLKEMLNAAQEEILGPDEELMSGLQQAESPLGATSYIIPDVYQTVVFDQWATDVDFNRESQYTNVRVGNDVAFGGGGIGLQGDITNVMVGFKNTFVSTYTGMESGDVAISVLQGNYGVSISSSLESQSWLVETAERGVQTSTLFAWKDKDFGQRVKVRNFELMIRHDFDEIIQPSSKSANSLTLLTRDLSVAVNSDWRDREIGVGVSYRRIQVSSIADFRDLLFESKASWGSAWHGSLSLDLPTFDDTSMYARFGLGTLGRAWIGAGAGVTALGVPQLSVEAQAGRVTYSNDFIQDKNSTGKFINNNQLGIGRFYYNWESHMAPNAVRNRLQGLFG